MGTKVYIEHGGCDRRLLDGATIQRYLEANEYELVDDPKDADRMLIVTCAFKRKEEDEAILTLRSLRQYGGDIVVYGCLPDIAAERFEEEFSDLPAVAPSEIESIAEHFEPKDVPFSEVPPANVVEPMGSGIVRTRRRVESGTTEVGDPLTRMHHLGTKVAARCRPSVNRPFNLFVCRGCTGRCTYCAIRRATKRVKSKSIEAVMTEFRHGVEAGYTHFRILGDDPGCFGEDIGVPFPDLMAALLEEAGQHDSAATQDSAKLGFMIKEIHPKHLVRHIEAILRLPNASLIDRILCPLQSGSDRILQLMQREHTAEEVASAVRSIRQHRPGIKIDTQVIVGFPTETEQEYRMTLDYVADTGLDSVVVFPYDDKERTPASKLDGKVAPEEIRQRVTGAFSFFRRRGIQAYDSCPP